MDLSWTLIAAGFAGLIALAVAPRQPKGIRAALFWIGLSGSILLAGVGFFRLATQPKPWADVALHCIIDVRTGGTTTQWGHIPELLSYLGLSGATSVDYLDRPQFDAVSGAMFQLSAAPFLRCHLTNGGMLALNHVGVFFQYAFVPVPVLRKTAHYRYVHINIKNPKWVVIAADIVKGNGGFFDFGIANFGSEPLFIRGVGLSTNSFDTLLSNVEAEDSKGWLSENLLLPTQGKKSSSWIFESNSGCKYDPKLLPASPSPLAIAEMNAASESMKRHPMPGCALH